MLNKEFAKDELIKISNPELNYGYEVYKITKVGRRFLHISSEIFSDSLYKRVDPKRPDTLYLGKV